MDQDYKIFYSAMKFLKSVSVAKYPIKIRRQKISKEFHGYCMFKKDHFLIKINKDLSEQHSIDIMMHEIAHADSWSEGIHHDIDWAISYRRLYRLWEQYLKSFSDKDINGKESKYKFKFNCES